MPPCECLDEKINKILDALKEMDDKEFERLLSRGNREGRTIDELVEEMLSKKYKK